MEISPGTRLGPYEVTALIGAGGMGQVYRATDMKLKRDVAVKVLPAALASDADRLARFQREAEVLASLNHPNIAAIHGLEEAAGIKALVMELVEGPTLADRIARGAVPLDEALPIARQIAEALEAAHERSIIHRDLKPANIKVRDDGVVKVLDFGLAKALEPAGTRVDLSQSPTITSPAMTQAGLILGTAAYMSPEQARGKTVDRRADLWAFGVVLFEMLAGAPAFQGEDVGDTLAAVVKTEVDWKRLPAATPAAIRTLLRRCLRKDPRQRLGDAAAARLEIEDALANSTADSAAQVPQSRRVALLPVTVAVGLSALVVGLAIGAWLRAPADPVASSGVARLALPLSSGSELAEGASVAISPDGARVAYVARQGGVSQLHTRLMDDLEARRVSGTEGAANPFFSPDGQWVGFFADDKLKKASTTSGVIVTLSDGGVATAGGTWGPNDTIVFRSRTSLVEIPAAGGAPRPLQTPEQVTAGGLLQFPHFLPGGKAILVSATRPGGSTADDRAIGVLTLETGELKSLVQGGASPRFLPTGHLAFLRDGTLMAVPLDLDRLELVGTPGEVLAGVRQTNFNQSGSFSCSRGGTCVYVAGGTADQRTVALVDRAGTSRPLPLPPKSYLHPRFSPAGDKLLFWVEQLRCDIEVYDLQRGTVTRLVSDGDNHYPVWTPDGQRITYESGRRAGPDSEYPSQTVWQLANGGGAEEILATAQGPTRPASLSWSRSGELAFVEQGDIWLLARPGEGKPRPFAPSRFREMMPAFSPDGRWLAYVSDESGRFEVYVRPFPGPGERYPISTAGGSEPVWARSGKELFFREGDQVMAVEIVAQPAFSASRPRLLFTGNYLRAGGRINYDVSPDGSFVMVNPGEEDRPATRIEVLLNWHEELKRLVPVN